MKSPTRRTQIASIALLLAVSSWTFVSVLAGFSDLVQRGSEGEAATTGSGINSEHPLPVCEFSAERAYFPISYHPILASPQSGAKDNGIGRRQLLFGAVIAAATSPPPGPSNLVAWLFQKLEDALADVTQSSLELLLQLNLGCALATAAMFFLWRNARRVKSLHAAALLLCLFIGLAIPVGWVAIKWRFLRALIVLLAFMGLIVWSWAIPFFFHQRTSKQIPLRIGLAAIFLLLLVLNPILKNLYEH